MHGAYIYDIFSRLEKFEKNFTTKSKIDKYAWWKRLAQKVQI